MRRARHCLVPASGYYEWQAGASGKIPHYITSLGGNPFGFAGLWEHRTDKETGEILRTFTIVTTDANVVTLPIHNRMPVILVPEDYETRLSGSPEAAQALLHPYGGEMYTYPVSKRVNSPRNNDPGLISPDDPPALPLQ